MDTFATLISPDLVDDLPDWSPESLQALAARDTPRPAPHDPARFVFLMILAFTPCDCVEVRHGSGKVKI